MNSVGPSRLDNEDVLIPRWIQVPVGIVLALFTLLCLVGSATLIFSSNEKAPIFAPMFGISMVAVCCWVLEKCIRLIFGRKIKGGIMSPTALRIVGWVFLILPLGGLFTGYFRIHTLFAVVQIAAYISLFLGLRKLAAYRERNYAQPINSDNIKKPDC